MNLSLYNIAILTLAILFIWVPWLWRYQLKPRAAKKALRQLLQKHPQAAELVKIESFLLKLFRKVNSTRVSKQERNRLGITDDAFVYGEIEFLPFYTMLDRTRPRAGEIFYDLGSGAGKAVFAAACFFNFKKACGIELLPGLYHKANQLQQMAQSQPNIPADKLRSIAFINNNFMNIDFTDGDVIFINATCLDYTTWQNLLQKLAQLKPGSRVIVTTKKIPLPEFKLVYEGREPMSWGLNSVNIYSKLS